MFNSGICINWTRAHGSGHCATILIRQKCRNRVFEPIRIGPMCPDTELEAEGRCLARQYESPLSYSHL